VAARCLNCGNCTWSAHLFLPYSGGFLDLPGAVAERRRRLDSCFTVDFSYLHGGSIRTSPGPLPPVVDPQAGHLD